MPGSPQGQRGGQFGKTRGSGSGNPGSSPNSATQDSPHSSRSLGGPVITCTAKPPPVKSCTVRGTPALSVPTWPLPLCGPGPSPRADLAPLPVQTPAPLLCVACGTWLCASQADHAESGGTGLHQKYEGHTKGSESSTRVPMFGSWLCHLQRGHHGPVSCVSVPTVKPR